MKQVIAVTYEEGGLYNPPPAKKTKMQMVSAFFYDDGSVYDRVLRKHRMALHCPADIIAAIAVNREFNLLRRHNHGV
jgi:hypothetical protein